MNDDNLVRKLNSVGKAAFVFHFDLFRRYSQDQISKLEIIELLVDQDVSNESGAAIRSSNAILIFRAGREVDALQLVVDSTLGGAIKKLAQQIISDTGDAVEHNVSPQVREILSWRLATEFWRRFPDRYELIETHPCSGQYDCLTLWNKEKEAGEVDINRAGSLHVSPSQTGFSTDWDKRMLAGETAAILDEISNYLDLVIPKKIPSSTPMTLAFRFITEFLGHSFGRLEHWGCRNGFEDTSGYGGGKREDLFAAFPHAPSLSNAITPRHLNHAYYSWFLLKDGEPRVCIDTEGRISTSDGKVHDLRALYKKHKRIWPIILETCSSILP